MNLEVKTTRQIDEEWALAAREYRDILKKGLPTPKNNGVDYNKEWVSVESLLELSPKELLDEVRKLHIQKFEQEKNKIKELEN